MKKKIWLVLLSAAAVMCTVFGLAGCGGKKKDTAVNIGDTEGSVRTQLGEPDEIEEEGSLFRYFSEDEAQMTEIRFENFVVDEKPSKLVVSIYFDADCKNPAEKEPDSAYIASTKDFTRTEVWSFTIANISVHHTFTDGSYRREKLGDTELAFEIETHNVHWTWQDECGEHTATDKFMDALTGATAKGVYGKEVTVEVDPELTEVATDAFKGCSMKSIELPDTVTSIGKRAFADCTQLESIRIPAAVKTVDIDAFQNCTSLKKAETPDLEAWCRIDFTNYWSNPTLYAKDLYVNGALLTELVLPEKTQFVGNFLFYNCGSVESIKFPEGVMGIGLASFDGCAGLTNVVIPDTVEYIGDYAFYACDSLTGVTLGESLTSIGTGAFGRCDKLLEIWNNSQLTIILGAAEENGGIGQNAKNLYQAGEKTKQVLTEDKFLFYGDALIGYRGTETDLVLPDQSPNGNPYEIYKSAFYSLQNNKTLHSVKIPATVTRIGAKAFQNCVSLAKVEIASKDTEIAADAFTGSPVEEVKASASQLTLFGKDYLQSATVTAGELGRALSNAKLLKTVVLADDVTKINDQAFSGCAMLESVSIGSGVEEIGSSIFSSCAALESVTVAQGNAKYSGAGNCVVEKATNTLIAGCKGSAIPATVKTIGNEAFYGSGITALTIPASVNTIGSSAFASCEALESVTIGSGVAEIGSFAFENCTKLETVSVPSNVRAINAKAFSGCTALKSVTFAGGSWYYAEDSEATQGDAVDFSKPEDAAALLANNDYSSIGYFKKK